MISAAPTGHCRRTHGQSPHVLKSASQANASAEMIPAAELDHFSGLP
jgi:hypothetical protein